LPFKLSKIGSKELVRVSFLNAISTVIKMFTGLISIKVIASVIGPSGIALLGQLNNFSNILLSISTGGINAGITKYISEHSSSENKTNLFLGTGFWITAVFSILTGLVLIFGAGYFAEIILFDRKYTSIFYIFGGTIVLYAFNTLLISIINGFKDYNRYLVINIVGSLVGLVFSVVLALKFGIYGALLSAVTYQSIVFIISVGLIYKASWFDIKIFVSKFSKPIALKLGQFSLMALVSALTVPGSQLIVRQFITDSESIHQAGLWEGLNRVSTMYLFVVMTSLSVYYLPRLSELKNNLELKNEVMSVYKLMVPFLIFSIFVIYFSRDLIIQILFTPEFNEMRTLFVFQFLGDFLKMCGWVLGYLLIAKAMTKTYIIMEMVNFIVIVVLSYVFIKYFGTIGATYAYAITHFTYFVILAFIFRKLLFTKAEK
jgi:PST family polysaccharide transporter